MPPIKFKPQEMFGPRAGPKARRGHDLDLKINHALEDLWNTIASIPRGQVSTYADVARMAGLPGRARQTAYALRNAPPSLELPWHRVLGAGGRIVFPKGSAQFREQARRLRHDGISVTDGRVPREVLMEVDRL